jgi:hypothetical protein
MLPILRHLPLLACVAAQVKAAFKIYDAYTPAELQAAHGITSSCSDALYVQKEASYVTSADFQFIGT